MNFHWISFASNTIRFAKILRAKNVGTSPAMPSLKPFHVSYPFACGTGGENRRDFRTAQRPIVDGGFVDAARTEKGRVVVQEGASK